MQNSLFFGLRNLGRGGMQRLLGLVLILTMVGSVGSAWANTGNFEGYVVLTTGSNLNYYDLNPQTQTGLFDFNGTNLGTFPTAANGGNLNLSGGQLKTFKNNTCPGDGTGNNVINAFIYYTVYPTGARPASPVFTAVNLPFDANLSASDQRWTNQSNTANLLVGRAAGNYTLEVYGTSDYNGCNVTGTNFYSNNSLNYSATFSVGSLCGTVVHHRQHLAGYGH